MHPDGLSTLHGRKRYEAPNGKAALVVGQTIWLCLHHTPNCSLASMHSAQMADMLVTCPSTAIATNCRAYRPRPSTHSQASSQGSWCCAKRQGCTPFNCWCCHNSSFTCTHTEQQHTQGNNTRHRSRTVKQCSSSRYVAKGWFPARARHYTVKPSFQSLRMHAQRAPKRREHMHWQFNCVAHSAGTKNPTGTHRGPTNTNSADTTHHRQ